MYLCRNVKQYPDYTCAIWATSASVGMLTSIYWCHVMMAPYGGVYACVTTDEPIEKFGEIAEYEGGVDDSDDATTNLSARASVQ